MRQFYVMLAMVVSLAAVPCGAADIDCPAGHPATFIDALPVNPTAGGTVQITVGIAGHFPASQNAVISQNANSIQLGFVAPPMSGPSNITTRPCYEVSVTLDPRRVGLFQIVVTECSNPSPAPPVCGVGVGDQRILAVITLRVDPAPAPAPTISVVMIGVLVSLLACGASIEFRRRAATP
jgi:hypothetical protein